VDSVYISDHQNCKFSTIIEDVYEINEKRFNKNVIFASGASLIAFDDN